MDVVVWLRSLDLGKYEAILGDTEGSNSESACFWRQSIRHQREMTLHGSFADCVNQCHAAQSVGVAAVDQCQSRCTKPFYKPLSC